MKMYMKISTVIFSDKYKITLDGSDVWPRGWILHEKIN